MIYKKKKKIKPINFLILIYNLLSEMNKIKNNDDLKKILNSNFTTKRATVSKLEKILYKPFKILDHGFVRVIDYMGDDSLQLFRLQEFLWKGNKN